LEKLDLHQR
ncbi:hypothetical protein MK338_09975, partial [Streptococcus vestibularis]|nr:hypothetical protein [Streptococcus vestibularis]